MQVHPDHKPAVQHLASACREIAGGSFCMEAVREAFAQGAAALAMALGRPVPNHAPLLDRLFPTAAALSRSPRHHVSMVPAPADSDAEEEPDQAMRLPLPPFAAYGNGNAPGMPQKGHNVMCRAAVQHVFPSAGTCTIKVS